METQPEHPMRTVVSPRWDADWIAKVAETENRLNRAICGSRTMAGTPCELYPNHPNGRCKFHGGFDLTGAPKGNRNAMIHALYSRRLRTCSPECPQWRECPCAGPEVAQLDPKQRPTCPYEQTEYNAALTDALSTLSQNNNRNFYMHHIAHNIALLQVMLSRAALSLRAQDLVDEPQLPPDNIVRPNAPRPRVSPRLQALLRIQTELRRTYALIAAKETVNTGLDEDRIRHQRGQLDNDTALESSAQRDLYDYEPPTDADLARNEIRYAKFHAANENLPEALTRFQKARDLDAAVAVQSKQSVIDAWKHYFGGWSRQKFARFINESAPDPQPEKVE